MLKSSSKNNRLALVTGGGHGLGKEIALTLAKEGIDIIICGRNKKYLQTTAREIEQLGVAAYFYDLDAIEPGQVKNLFSKLVVKIGHLDILVNQIGGVKKFGNFSDLSIKDWQESWNLNFLTSVNFCREAIPFLAKSKCARIINISSVPAHQPGQFNPHYSTAKAALLNLSKYLSNFLAKDNILVNTICPGTLYGGNWNEKAQSKAHNLNISFKKAEIMLRQEEEKKVPLGRIGQLKDVANVVAFLASEKANFITGVCINVDGGIVKSVV